jgi:hypothetical protein
MIMVIHTFGDYARFHPHLHAIVADGLFRAKGTFFACPKETSKRWKRSSVPRSWPC